LNSSITYASYILIDISEQNFRKSIALLVEEFCKVKTADKKDMRHTYLI